MALSQEQIEKEIKEARLGLFTYIGNSHTKKLHNPNCNAIQMMKPENIEHLDHEPRNYSQCGWCASKIYNRPKQMRLDNLKGD